MMSDKDNSNPSSGADAPPPQKIEVIEVEKLQGKLVKGEGAMSRVMQAKAIQNTRNHAKTFAETSAEDLKTLNLIFQHLRGDPANYLQYLNGIYDKTHIIRGEAGTYGYGLVTQYGKLLCEFIDVLKVTKSYNDTAFQIIRALVEAINNVMKLSIMDSGTEVEVELIESLKQLIHKHHTNTVPKK